MVTSEVTTSVNPREEPTPRRIQPMPMLVVFRDCKVVEITYIRSAGATGEAIHLVVEDFGI